MSPRSLPVTLVRLLAGFVGALVLFTVLLDPYGRFVVSALESTLVLWEPDDLLVSSIEFRDGSFELYYTPDRAREGLAPNTTALDQFFVINAATSVFWDFLILVTLFAGFAVGRLPVLLFRAALAIALLSVSHLLTFGTLIRFGYDPVQDQYGWGHLVVMHAWVRQAIPVAIWLVLCPKNLFPALSVKKNGAAREGPPR